MSRTRLRDLINLDFFEMYLTDTGDQYIFEILGAGSGPLSCPIFEGSASCIRTHTHMHCDDTRTCACIWNRQTHSLS